MKGLFWRDGQFSWGLIIAIVFATASLQIGDLAWRLTDMPFPRFVLCAAGIDAVAAAIVYLAYRWIARQALD